MCVCVRSEKKKRKTSVKIARADMPGHCHPVTRFILQIFPGFYVIGCVSPRGWKYVFQLGGDCANPFMRPMGPSMLGIGFRRALVTLIRGTPWMARGSFIMVMSSLAGAGIAVSN